MADMKHTSVALFLLAAALAAQASAQTQIDLRTQAKNVDFSAAPFTKPFRTGTSLPASCTVGETFFQTSATAGRNFYACTSQNTWTLESAGVLGGDVSGSAGSVTVTGVQGRPVTNTTPGDGQTLRWNGAASRWEPGSTLMTGGDNYGQSFTSQTSVSIPGSAHGLNTANVVVECYDNSVPAHRVETGSVTVDPATFDVGVTFTTPQSGRCVVNGSGGALSARTNASNTFAPGTVQTFQGALIASGADRTAPAKTGTSLPATCATGDQFFKADAGAGQNLYFCTPTDAWTQMSGASPVTAVFGRTGSVSAQTGDYTFSQIAGTVQDSQIAAGVNAAKIGAGTVSNAAWGYLAAVQSDVQAQLNGKSAAAHTHTLGGDVTGDIAGTTVAGLQGRAVSANSPTDGQTLVWSATANSWQPALASTSSVSMASQLGDLVVVRNSPSVLTIGPNCSSATPCNVRFGNLVYTFTRSCTATFSSGTGTAYIYVSSGGTLTIGHNFAATASAGCLAQPSVTSFPADSIPLYTWTATSYAWDIEGGMDRRAWLSSKTVIPGTGLATVESGGRTMVSVDSALVPAYLSAATTLNFPPIAPGSCSTDQTIALPGALAGDSVAAGWPGALEAGLVGMMRVSAADLVSARLCNLSGATLDPAAGTFRATVVRSF